MSLPPSRLREGPGVGALSGASGQAHLEPLPLAGGAFDSADRPVTLAAITGAHGITGEVRLKLFGDGWETLKAYPAFNNGTLSLAKIRSDNKGGAVARFTQIADRNAAEAMRGTVLTVPRSLLPALAEGEYYHADLIGLPAVSDAGDALGRVVAVDNFGAGDILEIERPGGKRFMVPMRAEAVPEWDQTRVIINAAFAED